MRTEPESKTMAGRTADGRKKHAEVKTETAKARRLYAKEKPADCKDCFFWNSKKAKCALHGLQNCYYLMREPEELKSPCDDCTFRKGGNHCNGVFCYKNAAKQKGVRRNG